jgi:hypothetical protein
MRTASFALLIVAIGCSSSSTNAPSGSGGTGGSATGGSAGASGGSAGVAAGGSAGDSGLLQCATNCNSNHSAKDFLVELKNYVCGNSPCQADCTDVCKTIPNLTLSCTQCLFQENVPSDVVSSCGSKGKPDCVDFAQCLVDCGTQ